MKFAGLASLLVLVGVGLISCSTSNSSTVNAGIGVLYVTTQGNQSITAWAIDLSTGAITTNGNATPTGNMADALVLSTNAAFVANKQDNTISTYTVNTDGTLAAGSTTNETNAISPMGMAIDPVGKFLFVANQGTFDLSQPTSVPGSVSVFSISGSALTEVSGSPFLTERLSDVNGTGPVAVAVTADGKYLYVANQFTNTVSAYSLNAGVPTELGSSPYPTGTSPAGITLTPDGNFLYVANHGSNNISAFAACTSATLNCVTPDGHLTPVANSPFGAGLGPVAFAVESDSQGEYLYVANYDSSQVSQFKVATQTGVLTALSPPTISTGANPTAVVVRPGSGTVLSTGGLTYYVFTSNATAGTISSFSYDSTTGLLGLVSSGTPITTAGQPSALAVQ